MKPPPPVPEFRPPRLADAEPAATMPQGKTDPPDAGAVKVPAPRAGAGGSVQEWRKVARRLERLAGELEALVGELPDGEAPPTEQAKAMRSGLGRISQHTGVLKRRLNIGK